MLLSPVVGHAVEWIPCVFGAFISAACAIIGSDALINAAKSNVLLFNMMLSPVSFSLSFLNNSPSFLMGQSLHD